MSLLLLIFLTTVSSQDLFSFAGIQNPSLPVGGVKQIESLKIDSIFKSPDPPKTLNGPTPFPSNCESGFWQRFRPMRWSANASTETRNQIREIIFNHELTREEKETKIEELVMKESPQVQEAYLNHKKEREQQKEKIQMKHDALVANLSPQAKEKAGRWHEKREEVRRIMENVPENIRDELGEMRDELKKENPWRHNWGYGRHWGREGRRWEGGGGEEGRERGWRREEGVENDQRMNNGFNGDINQGVNSFGNGDSSFATME